MVEEKITCYEAEEPSAHRRHQYFFLDPYAAFQETDLGSLELLLSGTKDLTM
jgi:hypothetical protein